MGMLDTEDLFQMKVKFGFQEGGLVDHRVCQGDGRIGFPSLVGEDCVDLSRVISSSGLDYGGAIMWWLLSESGIHGGVNQGCR